MCLQVGGAALQVSPAQYQGSSFQFVSTTFIFTVLVTQAVSAWQDYFLDVDPASVPAGWTVSFGQSVARGNLSTGLLVGTAEATTVTAVALKVRARAGAVELDQIIPLQKAWNLSLTMSLVTDYSTWDSVKLIYDCFSEYTLFINASGLPPGQSVYINCNNCPVGLNDGERVLYLPANQLQYVYSAGTVANCYPNTVSVCLDAYCTPSQTH